MSKNKRKFLVALLATLLTLSLSACWNKDNVNTGNDKEVVNLFETEAKTYTLAELKAEFSDVESLSSEFSGNYTFKPFYNVDQTTEFTFHFNSSVDPMKAVTVHTDSKCGENSLVYQINDGYTTENGVDVVVRPWGSIGIVLNSEEREDYSTEHKWGYASVYYLSVNYDLDAAEPKKLEKPIIIPFTIKNEIDTPAASAKIDEQGNLYVEWDEVENAVSYKIYSSIAKVDSVTREECGYLGDHLNLVDTVEANVLKTYKFSEYSYGLGKKPTVDKEYNMYIDSETGYVGRQNNTNFPNIYVTAVDAQGNESQFSKAVSLWKYNDKIPETVDKTQFSGIYVDKFLDEVTVIMADDITKRSYPINYYKIKEPADYLDYCEYRYEVVGTALTGKVSYRPTEREFPDEVISKSTIPVTFMADSEVSINELPSVNSSIFADEEYDDAYIDLSAEIKYPEDAKIKYDPATLMIRTDIELARMMNGGIYVGDATLDSIDSYLATDNPEYILYRLDDGTIVVEKANKIDEEEKEPEKIEIELKDPLAAKDKKVITSSNYVTEQRKSTEKQVKEADLTKVKGTNYSVFAENAEQKYLALSMINHEREVSLKGFPALQNLEYLVDSLYYVYFQNPYVLDLDIGNCEYSAEDQMLYLAYELDDATFEREKQEVYIKAKEVIDEIIKPSMNDYEKVVAIWDYLEANTEYEMAAYEYAKQNNFSMEGATGFENTFNVYGILCQGKGVCQSYAYTFKLLAHTAGIESVVVIGTMNNVSHAWNAINIDDEWYMIDTTNNINAIAIPYWVFQTSSDFIESVGYVLSDEFVTGYDYSDYLNSNTKEDYYYKNDLVPTTNQECGKMLAEQWHNRKNDEEVAAVKYQLNSQLAYDSVMNAFVEEITTKYGHNRSELNDWVLATTEGMVVVANLQYYN